jgi:putative addiction module component (TIGR02574 family)
MNVKLRNLPIDERIKLVEELWESIAADQGTLSLTDDEKSELDKRLDAFESDGNQGRTAVETISEIRRKI